MDSTGISQNSARPGYAVLVVDDSLVNRRLLDETLRNAGMEVIAAPSVRDALQILKNPMTSVDLVLSDIMMPIETGFDLLRQMKESGAPLSDLPVLLITSELPEPENRVLGLSMGAVDYVLRSLDPDELVLRVRNAIRNHEQLEAMKGHLENAEAMAAKGRLLAASHHEIKNLATIIKATALIATRQLAQSTAVQSPTLVTAMEGLARASDLLADVCRNTNQIFSPQADQLQDVDLTELIRQVVVVVSPLVKGKDVHLVHLPTDENPIRLEIRPTQLKQVIINLIMNSLDAVEEMNPLAGGEVKIDCRRGDGGGCEITVEDNGVGLKKADERDSFNAFATTKQLRGGTGLGLWLSAQLVTSMNGKLSLASDGPGLGARARIRFPRQLRS